MEICTTVYYHGKSNNYPNACVVSAQEKILLHNGSEVSLQQVPSISDMSGSGDSYGDALRDFACQLDKHIEELTRFREEFIETSRAYMEAVKVDCMGKPIKYK